ncbi:MAG: hypothetical protein K9M44_05045 [Candidatus Pacebacteria bacterium]|nr:hypothetical protein [Candidatus Paceibacterota bacterium]
MSCQKEELINPPDNQQEDIKIFYGNGGLKSTGLNVLNGDTILMNRDVNSLFWAEKQNGAPVELYWSVWQDKSDDPPYFFHPPSNLESDQIAYSPSDLGYYKFRVYDYQGGNLLLTFYAFVSGIPGKVGDDAQNNYTFRMEKKSYYFWQNPPADQRLFFYFRSDEVLDLNESFALVQGWPGVDTLELKSYPFLPEGQYYYTVVDMPDDEIQAQISFFKGPYFTHPKCYASSWSNNGWISFSIN